MWEKKGWKHLKTQRNYSVGHFSNLENSIIVNDI